MLYNFFRFFYYIITALDLILIVCFSFIASLLPMCISRHYMHYLFQVLCHSFVRFFGIELHIHHKYTGALPERFLLISNHPSGADIVILNALFRVFPLAKEEIKQWWFLGKIAQATGVAFVKRDDKESRNAAKQSLINYVKEGKNLLIYPEGGCFGKHLRPFKFGVFDISINTQVAILPVYFQYEAENSFEWGDYGLLHHLWNLTTAPNKHAHCYIFPPIKPENFTDPQVFCNFVHEQYENWEKKYRL